HHVVRGFTDIHARGANPSPGFRRAALSHFWEHASLRPFQSSALRFYLVGMGWLGRLQLTT
ncbi:hypothetical protein L9F63_001210, partial [Diploptera punctata]